MAGTRGKSTLTLLVWLLASLATAALSHALIGFLGDAFSGPEAYDEHGHATVGPVALAALSLVAGVLLRSALRALARPHEPDPILLLARRYGNKQPLLPGVAVAGGGLTTLLAMEFTEQVSELGHVTGVGDALGGNVIVGLGIVTLVAVGVTLVGLRAARALVETSATAVGAFIAWIIAKTPLIHVAVIVRRTTIRRSSVVAALLIWCTGLRAPPPTRA